MLNQSDTRVCQLDISPYPAVLGKVINEPLCRNQ